MRTLSLPMVGALVGICLLGTGAPSSLTPVQVSAVVQAIEDEIYVRGYYREYFDVGEHLTAYRRRLPVYIQAELANGRGWVVYKLMPMGEVLRMFYLRKDGLAILHGDPDKGFPPTQPDFLTVYMDDEDLCRLKREWHKAYFVIDTHPSEARLRDAAKRQALRNNGGASGSESETR